MRVGEKNKTVHVFSLMESGADFLSIFLSMYPMYLSGVYLHTQQESTGEREVGSKVGGGRGEDSRRVHIIRV